MAHYSIDACGAGNTIEKAPKTVRKEVESEFAADSEHPTIELHTEWPPLTS